MISIEGKQTCDLVSKYGFPKDKVLFAGVVNGKNIWKNHYDKTLKVLSGLREKGVDTVISTSCSLLHVPYTLENEEKLSKEYTAYFSLQRRNLLSLVNLENLLIVKIMLNIIYLRKIISFSVAAGIAQIKM